MGVGVNPRGLGSAYQGALEATLAVVISVLFGVWLDTKFDASPAFFLTGLGVGFGAFILRLTRLLREVGRSDDEEGGGGEGPSDPAPRAGATGIEASGPEDKLGSAPRSEPHSGHEHDRQRDNEH